MGYRCKWYDSKKKTLNIYLGLLRIASLRNFCSTGVDYPHYFGNYDNLPLPSDCTAPDVIDQQEYPILRTKVAFGDQSQPGPDRVSSSSPLSALLSCLLCLRSIFAGHFCATDGRWLCVLHHGVSQGRWRIWSVHVI